MNRCKLVTEYCNIILLTSCNGGYATNNFYKTYDLFKKKSYFII